MLLEIYAQSFDLTAVYSVYLTFLLSVTISAFWILNTESSFSESCLIKIRFQPSASESAYKNKAELGIKIQLLILKRIRIKVDPGDEAFIFSP